MRKQVNQASKKLRMKVQNPQKKLRKSRFGCQNKKLHRKIKSKTKKMTFC